MNPVLFAIDVVYDTIVAFSVRCIRAYTDAGRTSMQIPEEAIHPHPPVQESVPTVEEEKTFRAIQDILHYEHVGNVITKNTVMYAGTVSVPIYKNPTIEFDSQIATIPFGELVMMYEPQGRFFRVSWNDIEGWVLRDDLVDRAVRVHPQFIVGQMNSVDHPNTAHVRTILNDIFGLNRSDFSLQAGEYVLYRLWKKNLRLTWPEVRPRVPGLWHTILRGVSDVHVGVIPKSGSIMEYMINSEIGHLAFVEAVFPDETISISEANYPDSGIYNERELDRGVWKELRPVFITVQ